MIPSLAERLRTETRALHTAAERSKFMRVLLRGEMPRAAYCAMLRNLHALYATLEPALRRHARHPNIAPFAFEVLARSQSLEEDLLHLHGRDWRTEISLQDATKACVRRLSELDEERPNLLLSHAYVRYLGDLSGGQILRRIVARSLGPSRASATTFYEFGTHEETTALASAFRASLGALALDREEAECLVHEAAWSFRLHRRLFHELAREAGWIRGADQERIGE